MKCPNCQSENSDSAKYCKKCGNPLEINTIDHESMINSISGNKKSEGGSTDTSKIIIVALAVVAVVLAGAFVYIYSFGDSADDSTSSNALANKNSTKVNEKPATQTQEPAQQAQPAKTAKSSMSILGGSFSTGSADADKTYAEIYVGTEHAGEDVIVQIWYSRDGNTLNNGNMVPASVHSDGYLYISSADAYKYYPDYATINLYDSNSNLMDTQSVSLTPTSGTQTF